MALKKSKSRRCPVCVGHTPTKISEVKSCLGPIMEDIKETGELPRANDPRLKAAAEQVGIAPHSLRFHLRNCLMDLEIQDQRFHELKDMTELLSTAKSEYLGNPGMNTATAVNQLLTQWRALAEDIEGQTDPSQTVEFLVEAVLGPINRSVLSEVAKELRELRESVSGFLPQNQRPYVKRQIDSSLSKVTSALKDSTEKGLKSICDYYKVELEAQQRKRAMDIKPKESSTDEDGKEAVH